MERPIQINQKIKIGLTYKLTRLKSNVPERIILVTAVGEKKILGHLLYYMQTIEGGSKEKGWVKALPTGETFADIDDFHWTSITKDQIPTSQRNFGPNSVYNRLERNRKKIGKKEI